MIKRSLLILVLLLTLPAFAGYNPLSDEPINSPEEFYQEDEQYQPEFEYPASSPQAETTNNNYWGEQKVRNESETKNITEESKKTTEEEKTVEIKPTKDYAAIYNSLEPAKHSYLHGIDPDQYYDMKDATWAPYPLLRLNSYIYFKNNSIEPGYYLLTPREHKNKWYLLFKQNGKVAHIIPVYERDIVPELFYEKHLSKPKLTTAQKVHMGVLDFLGNFKSTKRKTPIKCYMEINDLENHFVSIIIYYGNHKYSTIFRTIKL